jgi:hypothetical protein
MNTRFALIASALVLSFGLGTTAPAFAGSNTVDAAF